MSPRQLLLSALIALALTLLSIFLIDGAVARAVGVPAPDVARVVRGFTGATEVVSGMTLSKFALGFALIAAGIVAYLVKGWRAASAPLLYVGATHFIARLVAGVLKNVFGRLRPLEAHGADSWFAGGGAMPSGHAIHWWALFFPLALLFPRYRWPLLLMPLLISIARVAVNDHYVSDVMASAALAALTAWALSRFARAPYRVRAHPAPR